MLCVEKFNSPIEINVNLDPYCHNNNKHHMKYTYYIHPNKLCLQSHN